MSEIFIYILKLENNKFYVGQTIDIENRFKCHLKGLQSSEWTRLHKPLEINWFKKTNTFEMKDAIVFENMTTLWCMKKYGYKNVRGGDFCTLNLNRLRFLLALHSDFDHEILPIPYEPKTKISKKNSYVFILRLKNGKFFVSYSNNIILAIINEYNGFGSEWTKLHKPISIYKVFKQIESNNSKSINSVINHFVKNTMREFGAKNVRGGDFYNVNTEKHLTKMRYFANNI